MSDKSTTSITESAFPILSSFSKQRLWFDEQLHHGFSQLREDVTVAEVEQILAEYSVIWGNSGLNNKQKTIMTGILDDMLEVHGLALSEPPSKSLITVGMVLDNFTAVERHYLAQKMGLSLPEFSYIEFFYSSKKKERADIKGLYDSIAKQPSHALFNLRKRFEMEVTKMTATEPRLTFGVMMVALIALACFYTAFQLSS